ncbi:hypothetical protein F6X86_08880 [Enterococcus durans]|uniref:ABC superfamily ATP binding cassette transporter, ABC protein n=1 Tax=Enterococcus durans TaxID=53345 RepID=A0A5N0YQY5_9ENTE|nr:MULTISPECIES: hypothetical protein [Enterococcus]KAA9178305.1 hypothetical protein F6X86_08880 [Enterococcus durans]KAA9184649.1 hypothetical protein F6X85_09555 [Enterococcus durans]KAA9185635.1 hypothetical protein F6X90_09175 [Enterococcus durans]KAA9189920.1 hypothetical protein F6Y12_09050 [Enterococcus durans]KAA9191622.1 hypothetical protein F6X88_10630 [Enterococcus durans]
MTPFDRTLSNGKLTAILYQKSDHNNLEILKELKKQVFLTSKNEPLLVQKDWPLFPYLKVKDQVLLNIPENKQSRLMFQEELNLDSFLLDQEPDDLTLFEKIKLQLLHALLAKKQQIILEDFFDLLTVAETQELLDLLERLVKKQNVALLLLTHDETIARSQYVDSLQDK